MIGERAASVVGADRHSELERDTSCDEGVLRNRSDRDPETAPVEVAERRRPRGQPRFADAPASGNGDYPRAGQYLVEARQLFLTPDERGRDRWQPRHRSARLLAQCRHIDLDGLSARVDAELVAEYHTTSLEGLHSAGPIAGAVKSPDQRAVRLSSKGPDETNRRAAAIAWSCSPNTPAAATTSSRPLSPRPSTARRCG